MQDRTRPVSEQLNWKKVSTAICTKTVCTYTAFPARKCFALISSFILVKIYFLVFKNVLRITNEGKALNVH